MLPFRFAVTAALFRQSKLPVILMVSHDLGGGIRRHIDSLVDAFGRVGAVSCCWRQPVAAPRCRCRRLPDHPVLTLPAERLDDLVLLLQTMAVTRVHIHSLLGMELDVRALDPPARRAVRHVAVHDYYAICPQINLLPWRYSLYCGEPDMAACNACIAHREPQRRARYRDVARRTGLAVQGG